jgi:hypothetical protein
MKLCGTTSVGIRETGFVNFPEIAFFIISAFDSFCLWEMSDSYNMNIVVQPADIKSFYRRVQIFLYILYPCSFPWV